jgi:hypothetical protein
MSAPSAEQSRTQQAVPWHASNCIWTFTHMERTKKTCERTLALLRLNFFYVTTFGSMLDFPTIVLVSYIAYGVRGFFFLASIRNSLLSQCVLEGKCTGKSIFDQHYPFPLFRRLLSQIGGIALILCAIYYYSLFSLSVCTFRHLSTRGLRMFLVEAETEKQSFCIIITNHPRFFASSTGTILWKQLFILQLLCCVLYSRRRADSLELR